MTTLGRARSWLYVPGHRAELVGKALGGPADAVVVDREDAVPPAAKDQARETAVATCAERRDRIWVRVNAAGTPWADADAAASGTGADTDAEPRSDGDEPRPSHLSSAPNTSAHPAGSARRADGARRASGHRQWSSPCSTWV